MSLADLSRSYAYMAVRTKMAEDQLDDLSDLLVKWFLESDLGARTFLIELAKLRREEVRAAATASSQTLETST